MPRASEFAHLIGLVLFGALMPVMHLVTVRRAFADVHPWWKRVLLFLPPATPYLAWTTGHRKVAALWVIVPLTYALLRAAV